MVIDSGSSEVEGTDVPAAKQAAEGADRLIEAIIFKGHQAAERRKQVGNAKRTLWIRLRRILRVNHLNLW